MNAEERTLAYAQRTSRATDILGRPTILGVALLLALLPGSLMAEEEPVHVTATIYSPFYGSWYSNVPGYCDDEGQPGPCTQKRSRIAETNSTPTAAHPIPYTDNLNWDRAAHQRITIWSRNRQGPDYFCGEGYAGDLGEIDLDVWCEFWDESTNPHPAMYLQIEGENELGFTVSIDQEARIRWKSRNHKYTRGSGSRDLGNHYTGWDGSTRKTTGEGDDWASHWATGGPTIGAVRFTYETLAAMGFPSFASHWWLVMPLGAPHTEWDRIHFRHQAGPDGTFSWNLRAIPHEYGHVIYNNLHSGEPHYWGEVTGYMKEHNECVPSSFEFAHYEGYANPIRDLIWRHHDPDDDETERRNGSGPNIRCAGVTPIPDEGSLVEGNVADFYHSLIYGHEDGEVNRKNHDLEGYTFYSSTTGGDDYWLFPANFLVSLVEMAGSGAHNLHDVRDEYLREQCALDRSGYPSICSTPDFMCAMQQRRILSPYDMEKLGFECDRLTPEFIKLGLDGRSGDHCDGENTDCRSGRCDSGPGTQNTNRCIPNDGEGRSGDYCNHQNQCKPKLNCAMLPGEDFGECTSRPGVGEDCSGGQVCADGRHCDGNNRCVPKEGKGRVGKYCSNQNQCRPSLNCLMLPGEDSGECAARPGLGEDCSGGQVCADGRHCDGSKRCVPKNGEGNVREYCSNQNQCQPHLNCSIPPGDDFGECAPRPGISGDCSDGKVCANDRRCDRNDRCAPDDGEGDRRQYCSDQDQCTQGLRCWIAPGEDSGICGITAENP